MDLSASLKSLFVETAQTLKGHARRRFMAQTVKELGSGGQRRAERELGASDELFVYGSISKVTSDCLVDRLVQCWESVRERFGYITTLVINAELYDQYDLEWHPPSGGSGHHDLSHWRPVIPAGHGCN
jgi:hypothetical protein